MSGAKATKQLAVLPEGTYSARLDEAEPVEGWIFSYIRLKLLVRTSFDGGSPLYVSVIGAAEHVFAWRLCLGKTFNVRVRHKLDETKGNIIYDNRIIYSREERETEGAIALFELEPLAKLLAKSFAERYAPKTWEALPLSARQHWMEVAQDLNEELAELPLAKPRE